MSPEGATATSPPPRRGHLHLVDRAAPVQPLRVVDVAMFYGERSGGIRTYLDAKLRWSRGERGIDHHVVVPGPAAAGTKAAGSASAGTCLREVRSLRVAAANGYRLPLGAGALRRELCALAPDVVLLHDPFWAPLGVARTAHALGAQVVVVHHGSVALDAAGLPGPDRAWAPVLRRWMHHAYRDADAVMAALPTCDDTGREADVRLRFGLHPAFRPRDGVRRGDHVLYVGRLAREKGVFELLHAAARAADPWPLRLVGSGPAETRLRALADRLGIAHRVRWRPYVSDPVRLGHAYQSARAVVMPGAHETFGLVGFEAAASGASVVACDTAPATAVMEGLARTYRPYDVDDLAAQIDAARAAPPDLIAARALATRSTWDAAFAAELADLRTLSV
ncbi:MAG: glycosyltransferase [Solirubrobacteraceae bacterium MAG38_C4-C5]|nr:glycosyltransferase [Candidatus Siliceabacter maunaloa]